MEMGPSEGAMSSLSICVAGIMTAAGASLFPAFGKIPQKKHIALLSAVRFLNFPAWRNISISSFFLIRT
ncbi:MAG: hypothetical protein ACLRZN_05770 [Dialister invisus]